MRRPFDPALYLVTDEGLAASRSLCEVVRSAIEGGVSFVQIREKRLSTRPFVERAAALVEVTRAAGVPLVVNDRIDVALAVDADGVHVGQDDMVPALARRLLGPDRILGVTVRNAEDAREALEAGADYVACSAVFATPTKTDTQPPLGVEGLRRLVAASGLPLVAIGGIKPGNAATVVATGVAGIAVVSAIVAAPDPAAAARELRAIVDRTRAAHRSD